MPRGPRPSFRLLLRGRSRFDGSERLAGVVLLPLALALGVFLGFEMRGAEPDVLADRLYFLLILLGAPLPLVALGALYHDPLHGSLLPLPISAFDHLRLTLRLFTRIGLLCLAATLGVAVAVGWGLPPHGQWGVFCFLPGGVLAALGTSIGMGAFASLIADADADAVSQLRDAMAGPFSSGRHAPFLYLPALAFAMVALSAIFSEAALLRLWVAQRSDYATWLLMLTPQWVALVALLAGSVAYGGGALRTIARIHEEARSVYGGRPAPADPPYGHGWGRLLPGAALPYFRKELMEQARGHRALWGVVALAAVAAVIYGVNVGNPSGVAPLIALLLLVWAASLPTRRRPAQGGIQLLLTLPLRPWPMSVGRFMALLFPTLHLALVVLGVLAFRHGTSLALTLLAIALVIAINAIAATAPRPFIPSRSYGLRAQLIPIWGLFAGFIALSRPTLGLWILGAVSLTDLVIGGIRASMARAPRPSTKGNQP